jgi:23S rRNA (pseudouridine1915-N3)-methyltransferase
MHFRIISIGKPSLPWARQAVEDYLSRLKRMCQTEWIIVKEGAAEKVTGQILEASAGYLRVVLDERGRSMRSIELAEWLGKLEMEGTKRTAFLIGGAAGHSEEMRQAADHVWSLSSLTLQHEMALALLLEQLYRARAIQGGLPYHRE